MSFKPKSLIASVFALGILGAGVSAQALAAPAGGLTNLGHPDVGGNVANFIQVRAGGGGGGHGGGGFGGGGHVGGGFGGGGHGGHGGHIGGPNVPHGGAWHGGAWHGGGGGHHWHGGHGWRGPYWYGGPIVYGGGYGYYDDYYDDYAGYGYAPNVASASSAVARCEERFRSFNPSTGRYTTYSGEKRVCPYLR